MRILERIINKIKVFEKHTGGFANYIYLGRDEIEELALCLRELYGIKADTKFILTSFDGITLFLVDEDKHLNIC